MIMIDYDYDFHYNWIDNLFVHICTLLYISVYIKNIFVTNNVTTICLISKIINIFKKINIYH